MWWLVCIATSHTDGFKCLKGNWIIPENMCPFVLQGKNGRFTIDDGPGESLFLDINPSRYSHTNLFNIWLDHELLRFKIATNRNEIIGNGTIAFDRKCAINIESILFQNVTISVNSEGGMGSARFSVDGKICSVSIQKDIKYDSWKFALTILMGVIAMFIGIGGFFEFTKNDLFEVKSIPIDNPGEEYVIPKEEETPAEDDDEFNSDDGY